MKDAVTPDGSPFTLNWASASKPLTLLSCTIYETLWPCIRVAVAGDAVRLKVFEAVTENADAVIADNPDDVTVMGPVTAPEAIRKLTAVADMLCNGIVIEPPLRPLILTCSAEPKLLPLIVTSVPTGPDCGVKPVIVGPEFCGAETMNPAVSAAVCAPVLTMTVRGPGDAAAPITTCATAAVALETVTGPAAPSAAPPTEIPAPKLATVEPWTKVVNAPVMVTERLWPGFPVAGVAERI